MRPNDSDAIVFALHSGKQPYATRQKGSLHQEALEDISATPAVCVWAGGALRLSRRWSVTSSGCSRGRCRAVIHIFQRGNNEAEKAPTRSQQEDFSRHLAPDLCKEPVPDGASKCTFTVPQSYSPQSLTHQWEAAAMQGTVRCRLRVKCPAQNATAEWDGAGFEPATFLSVDNQRYLLSSCRSIPCICPLPTKLGSSRPTLTSTRQQAEMKIK